MCKIINEYFNFMSTQPCVLQNYHLLKKPEMSKTEMINNINSFSLLKDLTSYSLQSRM